MLARGQTLPHQQQVWRAAVPTQGAGQALRVAFYAWRPKDDPYVSLKEMYDLVTQKRESKTSRKENLQLIDVREPNEFSRGHIPSATNIPLGEIGAALALSPEEFKAKYGVEKPAKDDEKVIVYCRSGVRADKARLEAKEHGFNVYNYKGSWLEWNGGE